LALGNEGDLDVSLPKSLENHTIYRRFGDGIVVLLMIVIVGISCVVTHHKSLCTSDLKAD
jgi:hypothetical protein